MTEHIWKMNLISIYSFGILFSSFFLMAIYQEYALTIFFVAISLIFMGFTLKKLILFSINENSKMKELKEKHLNVMIEQLLMMDEESAEKIINNLKNILKPKQYLHFKQSLENYIRENENGRRSK